MAKLKRIGIFFLAKLQAMAMAILGLLAGILYSIGGFFYELSNDPPNTDSAFAFLAPVGMLLIFSVVGIVAGAIEWILYKLFARFYGGIELDIES